MKSSYINARVISRRQVSGSFCHKRVQALVNPNFEEIEACIVVGVEARGRPRAAAFVTLSDLQKFNSADLIQACSLYLAPYKVPILIHAVDAFPMAEGANGNKVQLGELRSFAQQLVEN